MQDPNEDTEWNDVLRAKGILPPKQKELELSEDQIVDMVEEAVTKRTGEKVVKNYEDMTVVSNQFSFCQVILTSGPSLKLLNYYYCIVSSHIYHKVARAL